MNQITLLDRRVLIHVQRWRHRFLNWFFLLLTYSGTGRAWWIFALVLNVLDYSKIRFVENQRGFMRALFCPLLAWVMSHILKRIFLRARPSASIEGFQLFLPPPPCGSFPSGHAAAAIAFFLGLIWIGHPLALWVGIWAVLVSFSRIYCGVHYLSDVIGGALLGAGCAAGLMWVLQMNSWL